MKMTEAEWEVWAAREYARMPLEQVQAMLALPEIDFDLHPDITPERSRKGRDLMRADIERRTKQRGLF